MPNSTNGLTAAAVAKALAEVVGRASHGSPAPAQTGAQSQNPEGSAG